ncbi:MAG: PEP-CTERM sorting domain-containing protein [Armatimonadetes bacterium]|nr:PEP-CTERM sorting domain-containing protein [Armatimonadota bacterium]
MLCVCAIAASGAHSYAITIAGNTTPNPAIATADPCPQHPGYACYSTALDIQALSAGTNDAFLTAWNTKLVQEWDPTPWSMQFSSESLDIALNIDTYGAFNRADLNEAGAEIRVTWTPSSDQTDLKWIQAIYTNIGRHGPIQYYLDVYTFTADKPPVYAYSYSDHHFYDAPYRSCEPDRHEFWNAYLYLARVNYSSKTATIYEGLSWGYMIDCQPVPEPATVLALCIGLIALMLCHFRYFPEATREPDGGKIHID